jgi:hypoxia up-regulated 1
MAFGAAFIAANSSSSYKVRKVFLTQHPEFEIKIKISPLNATEELKSSTEEGEDSITYSRELVLYK